MALSRVVARLGRTVIGVPLAVLVVLPVLSSVAAAAPVVPAPIPGTAPASPVVPPTPPAGAPVVNLPIPGSTAPAPPSPSVPTGTAVPPAAAPGGNVPQSALGLAPPAGSTVAVPPSVTGFAAGVSVEDVSGRAAKSKRFKNPDGSTTLALSQRPVFFQDPKGAWQPVNTTVVADPATPGGLVSKANTWTAHFAPLPVGVRIDSPEGQLAFSPTGTAPVAPTQTATDTVTYVNAWPGVDLRYQVLGDEVKETIVLNRRPTSATFAFTTAGLGFTAAAGGALTPQRTKTQWTLSPPLIEDKLGTPLPNAPVTLTATGKAAGAGVAVAVSPTWLAAQPDSAFPILVDPSAVYGSNNMTAYKSDGTTCSACGLQVGNPAQNNGTYYWRSVGYFDYTPLFGQHISNATVTVGSLAGGTANGYPLGVWWASAYSYSGATGTQEVAGTADTQGNLTGANLTAAYDYWVHNRVAGAALGFTGYETPGLYSYKRFNNFTLSLTSYTTAPSPAQNQTAWATADGVIHASWTPSADDGGAGVSYKVNLYHQGGGAPANWVACSGTSVYWTGLGDDTSWYLGITAQNSAGSSAEVYTNAVTVTHPPGTPTAVAAYPGNGAVYVTWSAPADPGGTPIDYYGLVAVDETDPAHPQTALVTACCSGYPINGLTNGHAYAIVVWAHDHDNYSPTPAVTPTPYAIPSTNPPPYPVQQLYAASAANGGAYLSWRPPLATNGGAAVTSYAVSVWDTTSGTVYVGQILNIAPTTTSFYYPGLTNGHSYLLAISAGNAAGYTSVFTTAVTPSATPPPGPAANATAQPGDTYAVLQWTPPATGPAPVGYVIYRYNDNNPISPVYLDYQVTASTPPSYTWGSLTNGTKYLFYVFAYNNNGFAVPTATNPVTPASGLGNLLNPTNVAAIPADATAVVSWTPPTINLLTTYSVNAYNAATGALAATSNPTSGAGPCPAGGTQYPPIVTPPPAPCFAFPRLTLTNGTSYYFVVTASLLGLIQTGTSSPSPAVTPAGRPFPPTITNVANVPPAGAAAAVTWTTPNANGSPITAYTLTATPIAGTNPNATTQAITVSAASAQPVTIAGLLNAATYTITVTAANSIGTSDLSPGSQFTPTGRPAAPINVTATLNNVSATVGWNPPPTQNLGVPGDNGSAITSYTVTASPGGQTTRVSGDTNSAIINNLSTGTTYTFTVTATNAVGMGPPSQPSNPVTPIGPPFAPVNVQASVGNGQATVSWSPPPTQPNGTPGDDGSPITFYTVTASPGGATMNTTSTTLTFSGLTNGTSYTFTVTASNVAGQGPPSAPSNTVNPMGPSSGVTNLQSFAGDAKVLVTWSPPTSNGGSPITGYTISLSPACPTCTGTSVQGGPPQTYTFVNGLTNGVQYTLTVTPVNAMGSGTSVSLTGVGPQAPVDGQLVGLGDSYTAGQGNPPFTPLSAASGCNISQSSNYPILAAHTLGVTANNFSCSGATAADVTTDSQTASGGVTVPPQVNNLSSFEDSIVLTVGPDGLTCPNEACNFATVLKRCVNVPLFHPNTEPCQPVLDPANDPEVTNAINSLQSTLVQTYLAIHNAAPTARIYVLGYPTLFASGLSGGTCDYINDSDIQWLLAKEAQLNAVTSQAVAQANSEAYGLIHFVDLSQAFNGHELCSGGTEWIYGVDVDTIQHNTASLFHPTADGQRQMAAYLAQADR